MRALILGSFNPVTNAHITMGMIAQDVLGQNYKITYVPASDKYIRGWKGYNDGNILSSPLRVKLLHEEASKHGFLVSLIEANGISDGKTYNTISCFGFYDTVLCIGMDNINKIKKWYKWRELLLNTKLLVFERSGCVVNDKTMDILAKAREYRIVEMPADVANISSTEVRNYYKNGNMEKLKSLVPESTYNYLKENKHVYV